jgi:DNA-directed RNA polymerase subunit RPC12/RpoP
MRECSICHKDFEGFGHNPEPIKPYEARCCDHCNHEVVVPLRIFGLSNPDVLKALDEHGIKLNRKGGKKKR